jgi:oligosaccharide repeat unit polymerase
LKIRELATSFFLLYGIFIPVLAFDFAAENPVATLAMIVSCFVIAALLWSGRALLLNILVAFYVMRVYLTRPYVDIFLPKLQGAQVDYVGSLNTFYNPADAVVVYLSLLSLLLAWFCGLHVIQPKKHSVASPPWIFRQVDKIVLEARWPFWLTWLSLSVLNYKPPTEFWQGVATGEGTTLFAYGLFSTATINYVCLYTFFLKRHQGLKKVSLILLVPVLSSILMGIMGGSRSAIFVVVILAFIYWIFLNYNKYVNHRDLFRIVLLVPLAAVVLLSGLIAQLLRSLLRSQADFSALWEVVVASLDFSNTNNPIINTLYFGMTELLHRLSSLKSQFRILNDHFVHDPWETYNPIKTIMRTINDLLPGDLFTNMLTINQLFDYIYYDSFVTYNSETWSIQGTLYIYFGYWLSPVVVFCMACMVGRHYPKFGRFVKMSPTFAIFSILIFSGFIENGNFERMIPVDIVRPLASFLMFIISVKFLRAMFSAKRSPPLSANH